MRKPPSTTICISNACTEVWWTFFDQQVNMPDIKPPNTSTQVEISTISGENFDFSHCSGHKIYHLRWRYAHQKMRLTQIISAINVLWVYNQFWKCWLQLCAFLKSSFGIFQTLFVYFSQNSKFQDFTSKISIFTKNIKILLRNIFGQRFKFKVWKRQIPFNKQIKKLLKKIHGPFFNEKT